MRSSGGAHFGGGCANRFEYQAADDPGTYSPSLHVTSKSLVFATMHDVCVCVSLEGFTTGHVLSLSLASIVLVACGECFA